MRCGSNYCASKAAVAVVSYVLTEVGADCPEEQCVMSSRNGANVPFPSLATAERSARCLTVCSVEVERITESLVTGFGVWTSVDDTVLQSDSCPRYYEHKECQLGCALQPVINDCRDTCVSQCEESCSFTQSCRGSCATDCRRTWCRNGCEAAEQLTGTSDAVPASPLEFNLQPILEEGGLFDITSVTASQSTAEGISAFIWRVEVATETLFVLQSSLTEVLDLSYFSCQEVNLSLAVVNRNGSSPFTSPTTLCVHGGQLDPPSAPRNLRRTSTVEDVRPEFLGHAVIELEWDQPAERQEALTGYELNIIARDLPFTFPGNLCGDPNMATLPIPGNATSYVLMAPSPGQIPLFGPQRNGGTCSYLLRLYSLPRTNDNSDRLNVEFTSQFGPIITSPAEPVVTQSCERRVDIDTGLVAISLNFSYNYDPLIEGAIVRYIVDIFDTKPSGVRDSPVARLVYNMDPTLIEISTGAPSNKFTVTRTSDGVFGEVVVFDLWPKKAAGDNSSFYTFELTALRNDTMIWWRPLPSFNSCLQSGVTEKPSVIIADDIVILDDPPFTRTEVGQSQYIVSLGVAWDPPRAPYGAEEYEIYLGGQPVEEDSQEPFTLTVRGMTNTTLERTINLEDDQIIYLQIRSRNDFFVSDWSDPKNIVETDVTTGGPDEGGSGSSSLPVSIIAAIVAVVVVLVLAVGITALVVFLCINHRRKAKLLSSLQGDHRETLFLRYRGLERGSSNRDIIRNLLPMEDEWEIPPVAVEVEKQLGEGCFGQVYKGFVRGPIPGSRTMKDSIFTAVAIKYLKGKANSGERRDFVNEIEMMKRVAQGTNPHVVSLIGCVTREEPLCLIIEYLKYGDLRAYLHSIKEELGMRRYVNKLKATDTSSSEAYTEGSYIIPGEEEEDGEKSDDKDMDNDAQPYLTPLRSEPQPYLKPVSAVSMPDESPYATLGDVEPVNLVSFAYQIAAGMEYLSSLEIVHRDLACRNVLVGEGKALKIADFGLSRVVSEGDAYVKTTAGRLPIKWMAIESINDREFTVQSDVWAFGVVIWEIATLGGFPYPSIPNEELLEYLLQNNRLEKPPNCPDNIYEVMVNCWQANPGKRPTFTELRVMFETILMDASSYIQFTSLTDLAPAQKGDGPQPRPLTGKSSNPYVVEPNKASNKTTPLNTPVEEAVNSRLPAIDEKQQSEVTLSPGANDDGAYIHVLSEPTD